MVVCYKRSGDTDHILIVGTLKEAVKVRTEWGLSIGLKPEPSIDFGYYPTIWAYMGSGDINDRCNYIRLPGY